MKIPLAKAHEILSNCAAVIIEDNCLFTNVVPLTGDDENEFASFFFDDDRSDGMFIKFQEGNNRTVEVVGSSMFLQDHEGDDIQLTILQPAKLDL